MVKYFINVILFTGLFVSNMHGMILDLSGGLPKQLGLTEPGRDDLSYFESPRAQDSVSPASSSNLQVPGQGSDQITVMFGEPTTNNPRALDFMSTSDLVSIQVGASQSGRSRADSAPVFHEEDTHGDQRNAGGWCSKIRSCFSACRRKKSSKSPSTHTTPGKRSCAYIFFKNRCIQVVISGAITLGSAGGSLYGAECALDGLFSIGGNTAILSEILLGGLLYTVFLVTAQLLVYRFFEGSLPSQRILHGIGNAVLAAAPATAVRSWFTLYPMALATDSSLLVPVIVYNVFGVLYLVFGAYKETCSPEPAMIFGNPLSDGCKIMLQNPYLAIQDSMNRRAEKIQQAQGGMLDPFLCNPSSASSS